jgi:membrane protease YdiL (CAAX protease family)
MVILRILWNSKQRRLRAMWRVLIQGGLFLVGDSLLTFFLGLAVAFIYSTVGGFSSKVNGAQDLSTFLSNFFSFSQVGGVLFGLISLAMILLTCLLAAFLLDRRPFADFGFHFNRRWWRLFGFGLLLGAGLMAFIFLVELAAGWVKITGFLRPGASGPFWGQIGLAIILFICVGIYEELLARGYQLRNLAEGFCLPQLNPRTALVIGYILSSIIFGLLHAGNPNASLISTLNLFLAGLFLGLGYVLTGELALPIGLHITWNFFEGNVFGFPVSGANAGATFIAIQQGGPDFFTGGAFGPEAGLVGILAIILGAILIAWWVRHTTGRLALQERLAVYQFPQNRT